jgi:tetratricopeptide (TPR) repeat protein
MRRLMIAVLASTLSLLAAPAHADPIADAQDKFKAGAKAYREARYKDAIDLFLAANGLDPHPELIYNVGQAWEKLGEVPNALRAYREYLRIAPEANDRATVETSIRNLEQRLRDKGVQQVSVYSSPAGAIVLLDGKQVGVTPWTGEMKPGRHTVVLKASGYPDAEKEVFLPEDRAMDIDITLSPAAVVGPAVTATGPVATAPATAPTAAPTAAPTGTPDGRRELPVRPWTWAAFGLGVVGFGGAIGLEAARAGAESAARAEPTQIGYKQKYDTMIANQLGARVMAGIGAVGVAAGAALLVLDLRSVAAGDPGKGGAVAKPAAALVPVLGLSCSAIGCGLFATGKL